MCIQFSTDEIKPQIKTLFMWFAKFTDCVISIIIMWSAKHLVRGTFINLIIKFLLVMDLIILFIHTGYMTSLVMIFSFDP